MVRTLTALAAIAALAIAPASLDARNIVVTNDDGLTGNVVALYEALKADGHDVIVSIPCSNQSGMGAAIKFDRPLAPLTESCRNEAAVAGDPGAGPMTREGLGEDFFYVDGTPVMALLYGLDIVAEKRWGTAPDLVLSGPNEGQNVGAIVLGSGTVSAAQYAAVSGLPAVALSAGQNTRADDLDNPLSGEVARRSVELVRALDERAGDGPILPLGLALNVNFPDKMEGAGWRATRLGSYPGYKVAFAESLADSASPMMRAMAKAHGHELPDLPGLSIGINDDEHSLEQANDESVVYRTHIAVSPMQAGYEANAQTANWLAWLLPVFDNVK